MNGETQTETTPQSNEYEETTTDDYYYEYVETTTVDPVLEAQEFYSEVILKLSRFLDGLSEVFTPSSISTRKKRSAYEDMSEADMDKCDFLYALPKKIGELRDGSVYSLAKISVAKLFTTENLQLVEDTLSSEDIEYCGLIEREVSTIKEGIVHLQSFLQIKQFNDDLDDRLDKTCIVNEYSSDDCKCECHKKDKLAIYNIYSTLKMIDNFTFERGGDLYTWYYNDQFVEVPYVIENTPLAAAHIADEIIDFEKKVLQDIRHHNSLKLKH